MEAPFGAILVLLVIIATVASLGFYLANRYPGSPSQFDEIMVSNVIAYSGTHIVNGKTVTEYIVDYRAACREAPLKINSTSIDIFFDNGTHVHINLILNGAKAVGSVGDTSVSVLFDTVTICEEPKGYDHTMQVRVISNQRVTVNFIELILRHPTGHLWRAVIYLPEKAFPGG